MVASFLNFLESTIPLREGCDKMYWRLKRSGEFAVNSFYNALRGHVHWHSPGRVFGVLRPHDGSLSLSDHGLG